MRAAHGSAGSLGPGSDLQPSLHLEWETASSSRRTAVIRTATVSLDGNKILLRPDQ